MSRSSSSCSKTSSFVERMVSHVRREWDDFTSPPFVSSSRRAPDQTHGARVLRRMRAKLLEKKVRELASKIEQHRAPCQTPPPASDLLFAAQIITKLRGSFFTNGSETAEESHGAERDPYWKDFPSGYKVTHGFRQIGDHPEFEIAVSLPPHIASRLLKYFFARVKAGVVLNDRSFAFIGCGRGANEHACAKDCSGMNKNRVRPCGGVMVRLIGVQYCVEYHLRVYFADANNRFIVDEPPMNFFPAVTHASCTCQDQDCRC